MADGVRWSRADRVVWRLAPDRVLLRRLGERGDGAHVDLHGLGAMVWLLLDEPRTLDELAAGVTDAVPTDRERLEQALAPVVAAGWIVERGA